jgi:ribosomal protein L40E
MGWFGRKTNVGILIKDIKEASHLPLNQREQVASEMTDFIEEIKLVMQSSDHKPELLRLLQLHGEKRKMLVSGGFSANWASHAFKESYLVALIKASDDPKWFREVHTLLHGIRGPLGLSETNESSDVAPEMEDTEDTVERLAEHLRSGESYKSFKVTPPEREETHMSRVLNCPTCKYENPKNAKYCNGCGKVLPMETACRSCGHENPKDATFCNQCGTPAVKNPEESDQGLF